MAGRPPSPGIECLSDNALRSIEVYLYEIKKIIRGLGAVIIPGNKAEID